MIETQRLKRNKSFGSFLLMNGLVLAVIVVVPRMFRIEDGSTSFRFILGISYLCILGAWFFWFKAHYHWGRAKGYPCGLTALAVLGFPIAPVILACLRDQAPSPPPFDDPVRRCPHCEAKYRLSEYAPDAQHRYCSKCKGELPPD